MDDLTITTVIPTYRRPHLVRRAVTSVLTQTYPHVRAAVYDNASGDETGQVMDSLMKEDSRVTYDCHPANIGSYGNFNHGIRSVHTPFFSLLSDDDLLAPDFYAKAMECFSRFPQAGFVCMPTMVINENGIIISPPIEVRETRLYRPEEGLVGLINGTLPNTWTGIVFRKSVADAIGFIDTAAGPFADVGFVWKAGARFPFVVTTGVAAVLMAHKRSTSGNAPPLSGAWPRWWKKMLDSAVNSQDVTAAVRLSVRKLVPPNYRTIAVMQVFQYLSEGRLTEATMAAHGLSECGYPISSFAMRVLIALSRRFSLISKMLVAVRDLRRNMISRRSNRYHENYSHLLKFRTESNTAHVSSRTYR